MPARSRSGPLRRGSRPGGLHAESAPFPDHERYASTCGGRVEPFAVAYCTELE